VNIAHRLLAIIEKINGGGAKLDGLTTSVNLMLAYGREKKEKPDRV